MISIGYVSLLIKEGWKKKVVTLLVRNINRSLTTLDNYFLESACVFYATLVIITQAGDEQIKLILARADTGEGGG